MPRKRQKTKAELERERLARERNDRRSDAIGRAQVRPPDGVTFGKGDPPKPK
jgi:hypothetical protein